MMNCEQIIEQLQNHLDTGTPLTSGAQQHLEECPRCAAISRDLISVHAKLLRPDHSAEDLLPARFHERLLWQLATEEPHDQPGWIASQSGTFTALLAVAALLLIAAGVQSWLTMQNSQRLTAS